MQPAYQFRSEGDVIERDDEVLLLSTKGNQVRMQHGLAA
jgi:hypothetical protein